MGEHQTMKAEPVIDVRTAPDHYRHWQITIDGRVAYLTMDVSEDAGLRPGYRLKLNSYDLGVDIELSDAVQRLRFEHPEVGAVVIRSGKDRVFCSGANITMLGLSSHDHKVNFCKFTNETRLAMEDATANSRQAYICQINGVAAGGGYELALACDRIVLVDDNSSSVSLPELPLLAVLPGTGGLTRLVDKRHVRRDRADFFCTVSEGVKGKRASEWKLVDASVPPSRLAETVQRLATEAAAASDRPPGAIGIALTPIERTIGDDRIHYGQLVVEIDRASRAAHVHLRGPQAAPPADATGVAAQGAAFWPLALARELDDAMMHLRLNEAEIGTWVFHSSGELALVEAYDALLEREAKDWLVREITLFLKRTLKRLDMSARSIMTLVEPGSCFAGWLFEIVLAADRSFMLTGQMEGSNLPPAAVRLTALNFGPCPMGNDLTRLASRFLGEPDKVGELDRLRGKDIDAEQADELGLVTFVPDDIDWADEVRLAIEERAAFSPDALTGMEANLRFAGPETMETKIFARLTAWQNWIFQRPNAAGPEGALKLYGTGQQPKLDRRRV